MSEEPKEPVRVRVRLIVHNAKPDYALHFLNAKKGILLQQMNGRYLVILDQMRIPLWFGPKELEVVFE